MTQLRYSRSHLRSFAVAAMLLLGIAGTAAAQDVPAEETRFFFFNDGTLAAVFEVSVSDVTVTERGRKLFTSISTRDANIVVYDVATGLPIAEGTGSLSVQGRTDLQTGQDSSNNVRGEGTVTSLLSGEEFDLSLKGSTRNGEIRFLTIELEPVG